VSEKDIRISEANNIEAMPAEALALFGQKSLFSTLAWYRATTAAALPHGASAKFLVARQGEKMIGIIPMQRGPGFRLDALTTPYTCLWQPLIAGALKKNAAAIELLGKSFGESCRQAGRVRLDALDPAAPEMTAFGRGIRQAGLHTLNFDHFGNWHLAFPEAASWAAYCAGRPAALRETIRRRTRRLMGDMGGTFTLIEKERDLEAGIADYETVYQASWKTPEPFPLFNATLMREAQAASMLRLGILHLGTTPIAAQFWIVRQGCATVLKLAHTEAHRALSPGTVLSALVLQRLFEQETITEIDFGRGDDAYKKLWADNRRQRTGLILANPKSISGATAIARHVAGRLRKNLAAYAGTVNPNTDPGGPAPRSRHSRAP